jgi:hypothetical protein
MSKGYQIIEPPLIAPLMANAKHHECLVMIGQWLIQQLYLELKTELEGVELEIIKVQYHEAYPALGIHYTSSDIDDVSDLVERTAGRLLHETSVAELIRFISTSGVDWSEATSKLMNS